MGKLGKKIKVAESRMVKHQEEYLDNVLNDTQSELNTQQPTPEVVQTQVVAQEEQIPKHPTTITQQPSPEPPVPYNEVLKNVGAKIPYSVYDRLERIKRMSERTGNKAEKRSIGDLVAQAIKEFVERNDVI